MPKPLFRLAAQKPRRAELSALSHSLRQASDVVEEAQTACHQLNVERLRERLNAALIHLDNAIARGRKIETDLERFE